MEIESDEEPPIHLGVHPDVIAIDGVLGHYNPGTQQITIFTQGINRVAEILDARVADLTLVVRLHEWAHALLHVGLTEGERLRITQDESLWPEYLARATAWFRALDAPLHERLAQLLTYHGLCSLQAEAELPEAEAALERIARVFDRLTRRAPSEYQIDNYTGVSRGRIVSSIRPLKSGTLIGAPAWETVVTWYRRRPVLARGPRAGASGLTMCWG